MTTVDKRDMARRLRLEAEKIRKHGVTSFFDHTYACLRYGQASKDKPEDRCGDCPNRPFVPNDFKDEAFPCQHITEDGWEKAASQPGLADSYVAWLLRTANQLEAEAVQQNVKKVSS